MAGPRIGSLFTGTGALDLAVTDTFGGEVVWHSQYEPPDKHGKEDKNQYAARILARHWPGVPNLGDITTVDWRRVLDEHGPIDVLAGGFPCTDVSSAGQRAGLTPETRSGLWAHMARAIHELRPRLVVIENVEGLLSAKADRGLEAEAATRRAFSRRSAARPRCRSRRPGHPRVRCGVVSRGRVGGRRSPPPQAGLRPRLAGCSRRRRRSSR